MAGHNFVALDLGAESGRAVLGTLEGGRLTLSEQHRFLNLLGRMNGHLHWNLLGLWEEMKAGVRKGALGEAGQRRPLSGIGVDTWGVDFGLVSDAGEVLGLPYGYRDARTDGVMEKVFSKVSRPQVFEATGLQFMQFNTLYQLYAMKLARSRALEAAQSLLFMPDLFNYLFTGQRKNEFSIASTSQMYDPRKKAWATGLLEQLELPTHILGQIVPSGTVIGPMLGAVAEECGTDAVPVIAPGCHDTASAVAAVPAEGEDWCYISSGTWSLMGMELPEPIINAKCLEYNYTNEGGVGGRIRFLKNIMGLWLVQECRRYWLKQGSEYNYAQLTEMAGEAKPFAAVVDPDWQPFLSPGRMPEKIQQFCRQTHQVAPADCGQVVRTCLESLALTYRRTLEVLEDVLGRKIRVIHIVGGGTQNQLLSQMTADACGRPVIAGPVEATAAGNILAQAMATGQVKSLAEARQIVRASFEVKCFQPQETGGWEKAYERYRQVIADNKK